MNRGGHTIDVVRGRQIGTGEDVALFPGALPEDPGAILAPARHGQAEWLDTAYSITRFAPPRLLGAEGGLPHIRLDRAAEFLIGDRLA